MTQYHYVTDYMPSVISHFDWKVIRRTVWSVQNRDGSTGKFTSWWLLNHLQWYYGSAKCDGTESYKAGRFVYTDEPKELRAFRWRKNGPSKVHWDNMGGS